MRSELDFPAPKRVRFYKSSGGKGVLWFFLLIGFALAVPLPVGKEEKKLGEMEAGECRIELREWHGSSFVKPVKFLLLSCGRMVAMDVYVLRENEKLGRSMVLLNMMAYDPELDDGKEYRVEFREGRCFAGDRRVRCKLLLPWGEKCEVKVLYRGVLGCHEVTEFYDFIEKAGWKKHLIEEN